MKIHFKDMKHNKMFEFVVYKESFKISENSNSNIITISNSSGKDKISMEISDRNPEYPKLKYAMQCLSEHINENKDLNIYLDNVRADVYIDKAGPLRAKINYSY